MRVRSLALPSTLLLACLALAGCTAPKVAEPVVPEPVDLCAAAAPAGPISDALTVDGEVGSPASLRLPGPLTVTGTERTVVVQGDGPEVAASNLISYAMMSFDALTGAQRESVGYDGAATLPVPATTLGQYLGCAPVGSRVVVTVPATDIDPPTVRVFDVLGAQPGTATGEPQPPMEGMPTVELTESGAPMVTVPSGEPPAETKVALLKQGDGDVVAADDSVLLHYSGVRWSDGTIFDSSWATGAPSVLVPANAIPGYQDALVGQTVGSQVLAVIPPGQAYGEGVINENDLLGETLVVVLDILATTPAV